MRWTLCLLGLTGTMGCPAPIPRDTDLTNLATGAPLPTTDPGPSYDDEGSIVLMVRHPEPDLLQEQVVLAAVFADSVSSWRNLGACLTPASIPTVCAEDLPETVDQWSAVETAPDGSFTGLDIGPELQLGPYTVSGGIPPNGETFVYFSADLASAGLPVDGELDLAFDNGVWGEHQAADVAPVPDPMVVLQPDPTRPQALAPGLFRLQWVPGLVGKVYLTVLGPNGLARLYHLQDDGLFDLDVDSLGLADGDELTLILGRWTDTLHDQDGNRIEILVQDEQVLRATYRHLPNRTEIEVADDCPNAAVLPAVTSGRFFGRLQANTHQLQPTGCASGGQGPEGLLRAELNDGAELNIEYSLYGADAVGYLMTSCGDFGTCLDGANATGVGGIERLGWVNDTGAPAEVFIGLDSVSGPVDDLFVLDVDLVQVHGNGLFDACADAIAEPALTSFPPGTDRYLGDITAWHNYADPAGACSLYAPGQEGMVKVELQPGETLTANVQMPGADPVVYLLYNCAIGLSCPAGADYDTGEFELLTYTNSLPYAEVMYLIVDSHGGSGSYTLDLLIE